jgi:peptide/nickel transport system permease protein
LLAYAVKRLALAVPTLLIVALVVFVVMRLIPGDPAALMLGDAADPQSLAELRRQLGLDQPLPMQFVDWLRQLLAGDWGRSLGNDQPVLPTLLERFAFTVQLVLPAFVIAIAIAVPAGLAAARRHGSAFDALAVALAVLSLSVPGFWVALLLILLFGVELGWLPTIGYVSTTDDWASAVRYLVLPVAALVIVECGQLLRMMRASSLEVQGLDFVMHARAKGLPESRVAWRHVLPNALAPTLTLGGMLLGSLLGGAAVIETVFALPGLGRLLVDAVFQRDYPLVQGVLLFVAGVQITVNLAVDLLHPLLDPRVRL